MKEPLTIADAYKGMREGELTPVDLLEQCLKRIDRLEPQVKAWAYLDVERARKEAAERATELQQGQSRGPLHGIPVGIKDIIDCFDMPTGCGSKLWANSYARQDAAVVKRLRDAGAVILGKTVTTPYAFFDPSITHNPWDPTRTPGGSSAGSAAAVATGMCFAALASQTGGSITRPASYCGVASIKASWGRVPVDGVMAFANRLDHIGAMARSILDLAVIYETIAGPDEHGSSPFAVSEIAELGEEPPVQLVRLCGLFESQQSGEMRPLYEQAIAALEAGLGALELAEPPLGFARLHAAHRLIMAVQVADEQGERLQRRPDDYPTHIRQLIEEGLAAKATDYVATCELQTELEEETNKMLSGRVFVTPATTDLPPDMSTTGRPVFNSPWSFTGLPTISVPCGRTESGLPYAIQLVGELGQEDTLFAAAAWCEKQFSD